MMDTWRIFFDNLFDRPDKATVDLTGGTISFPGYGNARSLDGARNSEFWVDGIGTDQSIWYDITWNNPITAVGGQWGVGIFNHNCKFTGATDIEVQVESGGGGLTKLFDGSFEDMPGAVNVGTIGEVRDMDYIWLSSRTDLNNAFDRLLVRIRWLAPSPGNSDVVKIGQVGVFGGYFETLGGPTSPMTARRIANRRLRRTASGDPAVTPAISQSMEFTANLELLDLDSYHTLSEFVSIQRNGLPYAVHTHSNPPFGEWSGPGPNDTDIEGKGHAWMVSPNGAGVQYNLADRYGLQLQGIRQMGVYQWE